jgi:hypothetical protein
MDDLPTMSGPATYVIRVRGRLTPADSDRLGDIAIDAVENEDGITVTTLKGQVEDQAALLGVLNAVYSWQLPVVSVHTVALEEGR